MDDGDDGSESTESKSFREALLSVQGLSDGEVRLEGEWEEEELPENRWYKEVVIPEEKRKGGLLEIKVSDEEIMNWSEQWQKTLVINVLGKKVNYRALENKLNRDWARAGKIKIIDMPRGFYAVQFAEDADYNHALFEGPWMIADHYILVQRWRRNFLKSARKENRIAVWVRVPELPLELYNDIFLKRLGSSLGTMLKIDRLTSVHARGQFARLCVEIDLAKPVVPQVLVRGVVLNLEYEGLHTICFHCGVYGHRENECLLKEKSLGVPSNEGGLVDGNSKFNGEMQNAVATEAGMVVVSQKEVGGTCEDVTKQCVGVEVPRDIEMILEEEESPRFGPWIVVSKPSRKKIKVTARGMGQSDFVGGKKTADGHVSSLAVGSRFNKLDHVEANGVGSSGLTYQEKGNIAQRGELKVQADIQNGPVVTFGPVLSKVRNQVGGKNPQLGPRIKDVKRVARSGNQLKSSWGLLKAQL